MTPAEAARCVKAASQFARRHEPESRGFARDLNTAAELIEAQQKELERLRARTLALSMNVDAIGDIVENARSSERAAQKVPKDPGRETHGY